MITGLKLNFRRCLIATSNFIALIMLKNLKKRLTVIGASLLMVATTANVAEANFTATCRNIQLRREHGGLIVAECKDEQGNWQRSTLALSTHVGRNHQGHLVWQHFGQFARHCRKYDRIYDTIRNRTLLRARCTIPDTERHITSELNLDERIINRNGRLGYVN